jgi:cytochrome oxidase assembly protein ShyY1
MPTLDSQHNKVSFQWQWNWKIVLFVIFFLPVTIKLAFWQIDRAGEKQALLETYHQRKIAAPVQLSELQGNKDQQYVNVLVTGEYDNQKTLLLDNRVRHGKPGYEVISPFKTVGGQWLLVNRGWVPGGLDRAVLPAIAGVPGKVTLAGYLYRAIGKQIMLGEDPWSESKGLVVVQNAAPDTASKKLGKAFYDYRLRLRPESPGALETGWMIVNVQPGKHTGYAVQWSALALALIILFIFASSNLGTVIKNWRARPGQAKTNSNKSE